jgi:hypothetical protein
MSKGFTIGKFDYLPAAKQQGILAVTEHPIGTSHRRAQCTVWMNPRDLHLYPNRHVYKTLDIRHPMPFIQMTPAEGLRSLKTASVPQE